MYTNFHVQKYIIVTESRSLVFLESLSYFYVEIIQNDLFLLVWFYTHGVGLKFHI